jgi:hypothetical protein
MSEYSRPTVTSNGCAYTTLDNYNQNYTGRQGVGAPVMSQTRSNEVLIVPSYGGPGYSVLTNGMRNPSCSGYYNVSNAYPNFPNTCGQFSSRMCG